MFFLSAINKLLEKGAWALNIVYNMNLCLAKMFLKKIPVTSRTKSNQVSDKIISFCLQHSTEIGNEPANLTYFFIIPIRRFIDSKTSALFYAQVAQASATHIIIKAPVTVSRTSFGGRRPRTFP
jgi:hypothetical protein